LARVSIIFTAVHSSSQYATMFCASDESSLMPPEALRDKKQCENNSLNKFINSFPGHVVSQDWLELLAKTHPLYIS